MRPTRIHTSILGKVIAKKKLDMRLINHVDQTEVERTRK